MVAVAFDADGVEECEVLIAANPGDAVWAAKRLLHENAAEADLRRVVTQEGHVLRQVRVLPDGPEGTLAKVANNGGHDFVAGYEVAASSPNAVLEFNSVDAAWRVVSGESGYDESAGLGEIRLLGHAMLADQLNIFIRRLVGVMGL